MKYQVFIHHIIGTGKLWAAEEVPCYTASEVVRDWTLAVDSRRAAADSLVQVRPR